MVVLIIITIIILTMIIIMSLSFCGPAKSSDMFVAFEEDLR